MSFAALTIAMLLQATTVLTHADAATVDGKLERCEINFIATAPDTYYHPGQVVGITGSFFMEQMPDKPLFGSLKLILHDFDGTNTLSRAVAPYSMSLAGLNGNTASSRFVQQAGESDGSLIAGYRFDYAFVDVLERLSKTNGLRILFNRSAGGDDIPVDIDLNVIDTVDGKAITGNKTTLDFAHCASSLFAIAKASYPVQHVLPK
ncbi:hypothetical protein [Sphingomonas sp. UYEF23]|uniref:hypothetical protein n=1 Tax=Sphingomonas sp. UYEF23 TaxID=1756408 RepID=UPI003399EA75